MPPPPLRPYQAQVARAVLESVRYRRGLTFTVEVSRQGGKNELSSQMEVLLLTLHMTSGGDIVKASPTFKPQALISMNRLRDRLNDAGFYGYWSPERGYGVRLGRARALFLSAEPGASVVGHTAGILLEIDEAQDVETSRYTKDFKPMGASTNVTTVMYGTPWDDLTLLEQTRQANAELETLDGIQRNFFFPWEVVAECNPAYRVYVEGERARLGADHPLFLTQYCLKTIGSGGRMLSAVHLAQLAGDHPRRSSPAGPLHVAGLDVAGEDEDPDDPAMPDRARKRDSSVLTIAELVFGTDPLTAAMPTVRIVDHVATVGTKHAALYPRMLDLVKNVWKCKRLVIDSTGVGGGIASYLTAILGPGIVQPFLFTAQSKSKLAFDFLAAVNAGRLKMYQGNDMDSIEFWNQMARARSAVRANQTMSFFVDPREGHDDYLMSAALSVQAATGAAPRTARGRTTA